MMNLFQRKLSQGKQDPEVQNNFDLHQTDGGKPRKKENFLLMTRRSPSTFISLAAEHA